MQGAFRRLAIVAAALAMAAVVPEVVRADEEPVQEDATEAPAELLGVAPIEPTDPEPVDSSDPDAPDEGDVGGTCPRPDPTGVEPNVIPEDPDPIRCPDGSLPRPPVTWVQNANVIKFGNADGVWSIYKVCMDRTTIDGGFRYTVGPGYIARVIRNGAIIVNDFRARPDTASFGRINEVNGGLGTFGWHHARGAVLGTPAGDDPTTSDKEIGTGRDPKVIEGRMCQGYNGGNGAYARSWLGPLTIRNPTTNRIVRLDYTFDVWLRDSFGATGKGPGGNAIARVRYRYSFYRSSVRSWIAVTTYAKAIGSAVPFVKEPKLTALGQAGYRRMAIFGGAGATTFQKAMMQGRANCLGMAVCVLDTDHTALADRKRVRWDFATKATANADPGCSSTSPCLNVVMRSYPTTGEDVLRGSSTSSWEGAQLGLDYWGVLSGGEGKAWARDTDGDDAISFCGVDPDPAQDDLNGDNKVTGPVEISHASRRATPAADSVRRWEHGGWKPLGSGSDATNPNPYETAFTFFHGWEDGKGPEDCEPLQRQFGAQGQTFGTFASYSLNDGWVVG